MDFPLNSKNLMDKFFKWFAHSMQKIQSGFVNSLQVLLLCFSFFLVEKIALFLRVFLPSFLGIYLYSFWQEYILFLWKDLYHVYIQCDNNGTSRETSEFGWKVLSFVFFFLKGTKKRLYSKESGNGGKFLFTKPVWIVWSQCKAQFSCKNVKKEGNRKQITVLNHKTLSQPTQGFKWQFLLPPKKRELWVLLVLVVT